MSNSKVMRLNEGGDHILEYRSAVILGSIPFIAILTWRARDVGLSRRAAFWVSFLLCCVVLLFPLSLKSGGRFLGWLLAIILLVSFTLFMPKFNKILLILITKFKDESRSQTKSQTKTDQVSVNGESIFNDENLNKEELREGLVVQAQPGKQEVCAAEAVFNGQNEESDRETLIRQLIDQGFNEKSSNNFAEAVNLFSKALTLDPEPDLALYLIIDCYWLLTNLGERDCALTQLELYIKKYLPRFDSDLRHQFDVWMSQENLIL